MLLLLLIELLDDHGKEDHKSLDHLLPERRNVEQDQPVIKDPDDQFHPLYLLSREQGGRFVPADGIDVPSQTGSFGEQDRPVSSMVSLRAMVNMASVATNGGTLKRVMVIPLNHPSRLPTRLPPRMAPIRVKPM